MFLESKRRDKTSRHLALLTAVAVSCAMLCTVEQPTAHAQQNTTLQLPEFGVAVDATGVVQVKAFPADDGRLRAQRLAAARAALPADVRRPSPLRQVSLVRLQRAIAQRLEANQTPNDTMRYLAGLQRLQYLFCYPEQGDIVIAGPAAGWMQDGSGRIVATDTGAPVLHLDDLLVALRAFRRGRDDRMFIGCSIDPSPDGLARLQDFQKNIPHSVPQSARRDVTRQILQGTRQALGMSQIRVFGISAKTHLAQVLVEADYRMKRIGIGLEPPPVKMTTFLGALRSPRDGTLQRWWFQPEYDCLKMTRDRLAVEIIGQGVQLLAEDMAIGPGGKQLNPTARVSKASRLFATAFTRKYPQIAAASPVYAQMRNGIDMLVAAALLQHEDWYGRGGWTADTLYSEASLPTETFAAPRQVACGVNAVWKGNRLLSPAGGVSLQPSLALDPVRRQADDNGTLQRTAEQVAGQRADDDRWWWD